MDSLYSNPDPALGQLPYQVNNFQHLPAQRATPIPLGHVFSAALPTLPKAISLEAPRQAAASRDPSEPMAFIKSPTEIVQSRGPTRSCLRKTAKARNPARHQDHLNKHNRLYTCASLTSTAAGEWMCLGGHREEEQWEEMETIHSRCSAPGSCGTVRRW